MTDADPIQTGLIGFGTAGAFFHAPLILATPALHLAAVVSSRRQQIRQVLPDAAIVGDTNRLLADERIRLVVVATPDDTHYSIARAALEAGKHVVLDKPFTRHLEEADALIALADARDCLLGVFHNRRWDGDFLTVRQCIEQGRLGRVVHFESHFDRFRPQIKSGWREHPERAGGVLTDLGAHLIDQSLQLFGPPRAITADLAMQRAQAQVPDYAHLLLDYGRLRVILHAAALTRVPGPRFLVHGDAGSLLKHGMDPQEALLRAGGGPTDPGWGEDNPTGHARLTDTEERTVTVPTQRGCYEQFYTRVARAITDGTPLPVTAREARQVMQVLHAAQRSAREQRRIELTPST